MLHCSQPLPLGEAVTERAFCRIGMRNEELEIGEWRVEIEELRVEITESSLFTLKSSIFPLPPYGQRKKCRRMCAVQVRTATGRETRPLRAFDGCGSIPNS